MQKICYYLSIGTHNAQQNNSTYPNTHHLTVDTPSLDRQ
jgi:uncharacterized cupin superfamily protein